MNQYKFIDHKWYIDPFGKKKIIRPLVKIHDI